MKHIASRDNPNFKALKKLSQSGRERRKRGRAVLDGMHLIESYILHFGQPEEVVVSESGSLRSEISRYLTSGRSGNVVSILSDALFDELAMVETPSG
ncbi:MAG: RNA methyltransferase, partial [Propionivibrio sp.]|nr:RNA methyltransferase [Propionivibrio sp.]